jgi:glycosyltransferase involved in cell wall biosynthesis
MGLAAVVRAEVEVVMAVCNGEPWLEQQVASVAAQTHPPQRLLVLNDGSVDGCSALLSQLEARYAGWLQQLPPQPAGQSRGCVVSFGRLLAATTAPYVALADQDDLWDRDKLARALALLQTEEARGGRDQPLLVHSDARLIDATGRPLHSSWWRQQGLVSPPRNLWHLAGRNRVMGCTVLLNRACLQAALPLPPEAVLHDWWLALVACGAGGLLQDPQPSLSHRRHGANLSRPRYGTNLTRRAPWWHTPSKALAVWRQWCACCRRQGRPISWGDPLRLVWQRLLG